MYASPGPISLLWGSALLVCCLGATPADAADAVVRVNELNANIAGGCDLIELRVIRGGSMRRIVEGKRAERDRLAALPFARKLEILEQLRARSLELGRNPLREARPGRGERTEPN